MRYQFSITLNFLVFIVAVLVFVVFQTTLFNMHLFSRFGPDLVLMVVIYFGLRREFVEGVVSSFVVGYIYHLHSGAESLLPISFLFLHIL